jgi:hypothetical protein
MSSTVQATSSTSSTFITQLITDALVDYTNKTGIDLLRDPSVIAIRRANTPGDIIALFKLRAEAFQAYREGNRGLIRCLRPVATFIQNFSGILREVVGLVVAHTIRSGSIFNVTSSGPLPTSKGIVCCDRRPPRCSSF